MSTKKIKGYVWQVKIYKWCGTIENHYPNSISLEVKEKTTKIKKKMQKNLEVEKRFYLSYLFEKDFRAQQNFSQKFGKNK